jgi:hypothetical protein
MGKTWRVSRCHQACQQLSEVQVVVLAEAATCPYSPRLSVAKVRSALMEIALHSG